MSPDNLYFDREGKPIRLEEWADHMEDADYRRIGQTQVGEWRVSTVWIGLNGGFGVVPVGIFETAVFRVSNGTRDDRDEISKRYSTEAEALLGHDAVVAIVSDWAPNG